MRKEGFIYIAPLVKKKPAFAGRNIRSLKNFIYKFFEEKWTYSYIDKLDQFVNTISSRVNRVTKFAANKITKKDAPRLVSLSAQTIILQKPKFHNVDFIRIVKKTKRSEKDTNNPLLTRFLRLEIFRRCPRQPTLLLTQTKKK